ncbi:MAG: hypothetical protein M3Y84_14655 [Acidobacteriota bacterium]|nr:hypothetical protein [Acidobacteriota bacterium]
MIAEPVDNRKTGASLTTIQRVFYFALPTLIIIGALIAYKSSAALGVIGKVSATDFSLVFGRLLTGCFLCARFLPLRRLRLEGPISTGAVSSNQLQSLLLEKL